MPKVSACLLFRALSHHETPDPRTAAGLLPAALQYASIKSPLRAGDFNVSSAGHSSILLLWRNVLRGPQGRFFCSAENPGTLARVQASFDTPAGSYYD